LVGTSRRGVCVGSGGVARPLFGASFFGGSLGGPPLLAHSYVGILGCGGPIPLRTPRTHLSGRAWWGFLSLADPMFVRYAICRGQAPPPLAGACLVLRGVPGTPSRPAPTGPRVTRRGWSPAVHGSRTAAASTGCPASNATRWSVKRAPERGGPKKRASDPSTAGDHPLRVILPH